MKNLYQLKPKQRPYRLSKPAGTDLEHFGAPETTPGDINVVFCCAKINKHHNFGPPTSVPLPPHCGVCGFNSYATSRRGRKLQFSDEGNYR